MGSDLEGMQVLEHQGPRQSTQSIRGQVEQPKVDAMEMLRYPDSMELAPSIGRESVDSDSGGMMLALGLGSDSDGPEVPENQGPQRSAQSICKRVEQPKVGNAETLGYSESGAFAPSSQRQATWSNFEDAAAPANLQGRDSFESRKPRGSGQSVQSPVRHLEDMQILGDQVLQAQAFHRQSSDSPAIRTETPGRQPTRRSVAAAPRQVRNSQAHPQSIERQEFTQSMPPHVRHSQEGGLAIPGGQVRRSRQSTLGSFNTEGKNMHEVKALQEVGRPEHKHDVAESAVRAGAPGTPDTDSDSFDGSANTGMGSKPKRLSQDDVGPGAPSKRDSDSDSFDGSEDKGQNLKSILLVSATE